MNASFLICAYIESTNHELIAVQHQLRYLPGCSYIVFRCYSCVFFELCSFFFATAFAFAFAFVCVNCMCHFTVVSHLIQMACSVSSSIRGSRIPLTNYIYALILLSFRSNASRTNNTTTTIFNLYFLSLFIDFLSLKCQHFFCSEECSVFFSSSTF